MAARAGLGLLLVVCLHGTAYSRWLASDSSCNSTADKWDYSQCGLGSEDGIYYATAASAVPTAGIPVGGGAGVATVNAVSTGVLPSTVMPAAMAAPSAAGAPGAPGSAATTGIGFATGGAQDIENFRKNVQAGYLPLPTDVTFEGIVKDYYFDTSPSDGNNSQPCMELFCPSYSLAISPDPLLAAANSADSSASPDVYMAVGLDSGLTAEDFKRRQLNLVILLDVSGSMGSPFDQYYYDSQGVQQSLSTEELAKSKLDVAKQAVQGMLDKLAPGDRVSVVLFETNACVPKPLGLVSCTDMAKLKASVAKDVVQLGSTNLQAGYDAATSQLQGCRACMDAGLDQTENRIVLITDAEPNTGDYSTEGLAARLKANTVDGIFTTIVGVGLDFNTELVDAISKVKGLNYFSIHTPGDFKRQLDDEFDFMVTPLVFDLELKVDPGSTANGWQMLAVYGSPNSNSTVLGGNGTIMRINTLFPSPKTEQGIKGGVVLVRMQPPQGNSDTPLQLAATYTDRAGNNHKSVRTVAAPAQVAADEAEGSDAGYFQSTGVEKAVLLARYTDLLKTWLLDQWSQVDKRGPPILIPLDTCTIFPGSYCPLQGEYGLQRTPSGCSLQRWLVPGGCILPPPPPIFWPLLGRWERQSQPLAVNSEAKEAMRTFLPYLKQEMTSVGDSSLSQEADTLQKLISARS